MHFKAAARSGEHEKFHGRLFQSLRLSLYCPTLQLHRVQGYINIYLIGMKDGLYDEDNHVLKLFDSNADLHMASDENSAQMSGPWLYITHPARLYEKGEPMTGKGWYCEVSLTSLEARRAPGEDLSEFVSDATGPRDDQSNSRHFQSEVGLSISRWDAR